MGQIKTMKTNSNWRKDLRLATWSTNENGLRLVEIATGRQMAIKSTYFMQKRIHFQTWHSPERHTFNQIDHCLIEGRHFSDVIDVMAWKGVNIDSDHMLVVIKLRARIC
jgi:hypothetical protein